MKLLFWTGHIVFTGRLLKYLTCNNLITTSEIKHLFLTVSLSHSFFLFIPISLSLPLSSSIYPSLPLPFLFSLRTFVIQQIPSSNLFMVVVENKCDCSSASPVTMEPIEIIYILYIFELTIKCTKLYLP